MKHRYYVLAGLLLSIPGATLRGQGIVIDYDYLNPGKAGWRYESGADTTYHTERLIRVRREVPVRIQLQNVNTDALQSELVVRRGTNTDSLAITSLLGLVSTFAAPAGLNLSSLLSLKSRGSGLAELRYAPMQVDLESARSFSNASVADLDASIRERLAEIAKWRAVREQTRALRYNQTLGKAELLRRCRESLAQLTATAPNLFDDDAQARALLGQCALENAEYLKYLLTLLEQKSAAPTALTRGDATQPGAAQPDFNQFVIAEAVRRHRKAIPDDLTEQLTATLHETLTHYQALSRNTFTASLNTTIDRGAEALLLQFYDTAPTSSTATTRRTVRTDRFSIQPPGQWQLSTSFGLSLIQFNQRLASYSVLNGKIVATDLDQFTPSLAGYLQTFPRLGRSSVRLGVHVGVAVPLTDVRGVCFQVGPSLALGRQNALVLNAGLFTARATRLGAGLAVGDSFTGTLPTVNRYEWGVHVGVSFQFGLRR